MNRYQHIDQIINTYRTSLPEPNHHWKPNIQRSFTFIHVHLFNPQLTVAWFKMNLHITGKNFTVLFRRRAGWSPKKYILHHRIAAAKQCLQHTDASVTLIAISTGFSSLSSFDNSFKNNQGLTPTHWREQN